MWSRAGRAAALAAALTAAGCAATMGGGTPLKSDVDELRLAVDRLRQDQVATRIRVDEMDRGGAGPSAPRTLEDSLRELRARLDVLESQVESMARGHSEGDAALAGLQYDMRRLERLLDQVRVQALEGGAAVPGASGAEPGATSGAVGVTPPPATVEVPERPPVVAAGDDPSGIFQRAYADYTRGDDDLAAMGFRSVLERDPAGALADDALFYLAEIAAGRKQVDAALAGYAQVVELHPEGDKAPAALLKRGLLLIDANRIGEGVVQLDYLVKTYPGTDEARLARNKLRALGVGF